MKKIHLIGICMLISLISFAAAFPPLPKGIDGKVFEKDGITEAELGTKFKICNLNTTWCINGTTGAYTHSGRYSAAIIGNDGELLRVSAWNSEFNASRDIELNGSMHDVNIILNKSLLSLSPNRVSPTLMAAEVSSPRGFRKYTNTPSPQFPEFIEFTGRIYQSPGKEVRAGTDYSIINTRTGEEFKGKTGIATAGSYYALIVNNTADEYALRIEKRIIPLKANEIEFNVVLNSNKQYWLIGLILGGLILGIWKRKT